MVFSSVVFIFFFLPIFFALYFSASEKLKSFVILIGSYLFYSWWRVDFAILMLISSVWNFYLGNVIFKIDDKKKRKLVMLLVVVSNLCLLGYFKYFNFFADSLAYAVNDGQTFDWAMYHVILPIGISFYNFQAISYIIDIYRKDVEPAPRFVDFAAYNSLFPQLIAGPVLRYSDLAGQFVKRIHTLDKFNYGAVRFSTGLAKKVLIADSVAPIADAMFAIPDPTFVESWLGALAYTVQLYFDFSGYSSMAIGLGMMMGFRFIENFDTPYVSLSITEFWRRWHISLSSWLRDYLYIPLGGSRGSPSRTYLNLLATMVLGGLWHGANWTFVVWGFWHGLILALERLFKVANSTSAIAVRWFVTFIFIVIGWVFFRATDLANAFDMLSGMFGMNGLSLRSDYSWQITQFSLIFLVFGLLLAVLEPKLVKLFKHRSTGEFGNDGLKKGYLVSLPMAIAASILAILAVVKLIADSDTPFLYFQF